jgi:hypothetical protein
MEEQMSKKVDEWLLSGLVEIEDVQAGVLTDWGADFYVECLKLHEFTILFFEGMQLVREEARKEVKEELRLADDLKAGTRLWAVHAPLIAELVFCRLVDMYLAYLTRTLAEIFKQRPQTMHFDAEERAERLDFILQHSTMEELIQALAEKRVESLAYAGTRELASYFNRMKLPLFLDEREATIAKQLIEVRNLIVHHNGTITDAFAKRLPGCPAAVGERVELSMLPVRAALLFLLKCVITLDERAVEKFGLRTTHNRLQERLKEEVLGGLLLPRHPS